jgi:hypothetical protein
VPGRCSLAAQEISLSVTSTGDQPPLSLQIVFGCSGSVTSARTFTAGAAFITRIASRALDWPVQVAFMTAQDGIGTGLAGGSGEGVMLGKALGDSLGVGVATSDGVGVDVTAVPGLPQAASTRREASAPTPSFMRE